MTTKHKGKARGCHNELKTHNHTGTYPHRPVAATNAPRAMGHPSAGPSKRSVEHPGVAQDCSTHIRDDHPPRAAHELQSPRTQRLLQPHRENPPNPTSQLRAQPHNMRRLIISNDKSRARTTAIWDRTRTLVRTSHHDRADQHPACKSNMQQRRFPS